MTKIKFGFDRLGFLKNKTLTRLIKIVFQSINKSQHIDLTSEIEIP